MKGLRGRVKRHKAQDPVEAGRPAGQGPTVGLGGLAWFTVCGFKRVLEVSCPRMPKSRRAGHCRPARPLPPTHPPTDPSLIPPPPLAPHTCTTQVMRRIVDDRWPIKYPPYMSDEARDLISRMLERKPVKRIGMLQVGGVWVGGHVGGRPAAPRMHACMPCMEAWFAAAAWRTASQQPMGWRGIGIGAPVPPPLQLWRLLCRCRQASTNNNYCRCFAPPRWGCRARPATSRRMPGSPVRHQGCSPPRAGGGGGNGRSVLAVPLIQEVVGVPVRMVVAHAGRATCGVQGQAGRCNVGVQQR